MRFLKITPDMVRMPHYYYASYVSLDPGERLLTAVSSVRYRGLLIHCSGRSPRTGQRANGAVTNPCQYLKYRRPSLGPLRLYLRKDF